MRHSRWCLLFVLSVSLALPLKISAGTMQGKSGKEDGGKKQDPERALSNLIRGMQMDLEGGSSRGVLSAIDNAKFDDYPRFEDLIEGLAREDNLRVYFRQDSISIKADSAQVILDAEMELSRKDSNAPPTRRSQQIVIDFEATSRGWKIINITPRDFFSPL